MIPGPPKGPGSGGDLSFPQQMVINAITRWYPSRFPEEPHRHRPLWREADYPVVLPNGWPVQVWRLWPHLLAAGDLQEVREEGADEDAPVLALQGEGVRFEVGVGFGTLQISVGPFTDLHAIRAAHEAAVGRAAEAAAQIGAHLLGYGIQPATIVHPGLISGRPLHVAMHEAVGLPWLTFALAAGDRLRVGACRDELITLLNLAAFSGPAVTALCANSPIYKGVDGYHCSGRDQLCGMIADRGGWYGTPDTPLTSLQDRISRICRLPFFVQLGEDGYTTHTGTFLDFIDASQAAGMSTGSLVGAYLQHESLTWPFAQPHIEDGSVSLRAACQQPWADHMAATALNLGIVEANWVLHDFFHTHIDPPVAPRVPPGIRQPPDPDRAPWDSWSRLHAFAQKVGRYGMDTPEPFTGYLECLLQLCANALARRGLGEEVYLEPLWARLAARENPAQRLRRRFHRHGLGALLEDTRVSL